MTVLLSPLFRFDGVTVDDLIGENHQSVLVGLGIPSVTGIGPCLPLHP